MMNKKISRSITATLLSSTMIFSIATNVFAQVKQESKLNNPAYTQNQILIKRNLIAELKADGLDVDYFEKNGYKVTVVDFNENIKTANGNLKLEKNGKVIILDFTNNRVYIDGKIVSYNLSELINNGNIYEFVDNISSFTRLEIDIKNNTVREFKVSKPQEGGALIKITDKNENKPSNSENKPSENKPSDNKSSDNKSLDNKEQKPEENQNKTVTWEDINKALDKIDKGEALNWEDVEKIAEVIEPSKEKENNLEENLMKMLKDKDLTKEILDKLDKNQEEFEKIFELGVNDKETENKLAEELDKLLKDEELTKKIVKNLDKDQSSWDKLFDKEAEKAEEAQKAKEEAERKAEEARKAKEEAERKEKEAKEKAERERKEAERKEAERKAEEARKEAERKAEEARKAKEEAERKAEEARKAEEERKKAEEKEKNEFIDKVSELINGDANSDKAKELIDKDKDIFDKIIGKEENKDKPVEPSGDNEGKPVEPTKPSDDNKDKPSDNNQDSKENPKTEKTLEEKVKEVYEQIKENGKELIQYKSDKNLTGPVLERTEYREVKVEIAKGKYATLKVKFLPGLSREHWNRVNDYRIANGLSPLSQPTKGLQEAADIRAAELVYNRLHKSTPGHVYLEHKRCDGADVGERMVNYAGENILLRSPFKGEDDYTAAEETFEQFKNSPPHNANMLRDTSGSKKESVVKFERRMAVSTVVGEDNCLYQVQLYGIDRFGDENYRFVKIGENKERYDEPNTYVAREGMSDEEAIKDFRDTLKEKSVKYYVENGEYPDEQKFRTIERETVNEKVKEIYGEDAEVIYEKPADVDTPSVDEIGDEVGPNPPSQPPKEYQNVASDEAHTNKASEVKPEVKTEVKTEVKSEVKTEVKSENNVQSVDNSNIENK